MFANCSSKKFYGKFSDKLLDIKNVYIPVKKTQENGIDIN